MLTQITLKFVSWGMAPSAAHATAVVIVLVLLALTALAADLLARRVLLRLLHRITKKTRIDIDDHLQHHGVFTKIAHAVPALCVYLLAPLWIAPLPRTVALLRTTALLYMVLVSTFAISALLNAFHDIFKRFPASRHIPTRVFIQVIKVLLFIIAAIFAVSLLIGKSPILLVSGFGAMTAVLMLVFKDPLVGLVAGIQLSANRMLAVGDWLEMPKYGADGDVIDITLTTVKVQNWDRTISTVPTYALVSDSFKNWRGMIESGGRRIMRNICIDLTTIHFLSPEEIARLRKTRLLTEYIDKKLEEIARYNEEQGIDASSPVNGRCLTNIGTFRAYLVAYLRNHPEIHQEMIFIVRQLEPTAQGLPLQIYVFVKDIRWVNYEAIQSDIFDHIIAAAPEFGLQLYQQPSSNDIRGLLIRP